MDYPILKHKAATTTCIFTFRSGNMNCLSAVGEAILIWNVDLLLRIDQPVRSATAPKKA